MNCRECCDKLSLYIDGQLTSEECALVEEALTRCPDCAEDLRVLKSVVDELENVDPVDIPTDLLVDLRQAFREEVAREKSEWREPSLVQRLGHWRIAAAVAAVLFAGWAIVQDIDFDKSRPASEATVETAEYDQEESSAKRSTMSSRPQENAILPKEEVDEGVVEPGRIGVDPPAGSKIEPESLETAKVNLDDGLAKKAADLEKSTEDSDEARVTRVRTEAYRRLKTELKSKTLHELEDFKPLDGEILTLLEFDESSGVASGAMAGSVPTPKSPESKARLGDRGRRESPEPKKSKANRQATPKGAAKSRAKSKGAWSGRANARTRAATYLVSGADTRNRIETVLKRHDLSIRTSPIVSLSEGSKSDRILISATVAEVDVAKLVAELSKLPRMKLHLLAGKPKSAKTEDPAPTGATMAIRASRSKNVVSLSFITTAKRWRKADGR